MSNLEETDSFILSLCAVEKTVNDFINKRDDESKNSLRKWSRQRKAELNEKINNNLTKIIQNNLESFIPTTYSGLFNKYSYDEIQEYKETEEFKLCNEYVFILPYILAEIAEALVVDSFISIKNNIEYDLVLVKALSLGDKYLNNISEKFNLSVESFNFLAFYFVKDICTKVYQTFNFYEYKQYLFIYHKKKDELKALDESIYPEAIIGIQDLESLWTDRDKLKSELVEIRNNFQSKIIGYNALMELKLLGSKLKFSFKSFKYYIQKLFTNNTAIADDEQNAQLTYIVWLMNLSLIKKNNISPYDDDYILNNLIIPWSDELKELLGNDFDNSTFNIEEATNFIKRLRTKGNYSNTPTGKRYKTIALKKVFGLSIKVENLSITEYKYRDTLTTDYSDRMNSILKVLKKHGTKNNPAKEEKNGFIVYKNGNALDDSDIELFHYLIGELEEHGCETEIVFRKSDIVNNMGYTSLRGNKLDNLTSSLMNINAQSIAIVDTRKDKVGKRLGENNRNFKGTQLLRADFEGDGDEVLIKFTSPFSKYFRDQKQFGRLLNREMLNKYLYANTRVLKIARELSRMLFISNQKSKKSLETVEINYDTLIKNIDEWDKYSTHSNQRVYLQRLTNDISKAISYIENDIKHELIKPSPKTIKNGKIKLIK